MKAYNPATPNAEAKSNSAAANFDSIKLNLDDTNSGS